MGQFGVMIGQLVGFLIMLMVGYGCVRLRFYGQTALDGMCSLLLNVLIPVLVFSNAVDGADRARCGRERFGERRRFGGGGCEQRFSGGRPPLARHPRPRPA